MPTAAASLATGAAAPEAVTAGAPSSVEPKALGADAGAATVAPGGSPAAAPAAPAANDNAPAHWLGQDAPADLLEFVKSNGWDKPADVVTNIRELQRFLGADKAGRGVVLPKDADDADAWAAVYDKLGRPANADGYGLTDLEGADPDFAAKAQGWFHELGLSDRQGKALAEKWGAELVARGAAEDAEFKAGADAEMAALDSEWGADAAKNSELARRGAAAFGWSAEELDKVERAIGTRALMLHFLEVGSKLGEDVLPAAAGAAPSAASPDTAKAQIAELLKDSGFMAKVRAGDQAARSKWDGLYQVAYGR